MSIDDVLGDYRTHIQTILDHLNGVGIDASGLVMDHIAYRCSDIDSYRTKCVELAPFGQMASENIIRERPIAVFELTEPLHAHDFDIPAVEVLSPKPGDTYAQGLEHVEFVVEPPLQRLIDEHPGVDFRTESMTRVNNPELKLKFGGANVKFHLRPVLEVARLQRETGIL